MLRFALLYLTVYFFTTTHMTHSTKFFYSFVKIRYMHGAKYT